jgi:hypothetical protein
MTVISWQVSSLVFEIFVNGVVGTAGAEETPEPTMKRKLLISPLK